LVFFNAFLFNLELKLFLLSLERKLWLILSLANITGELVDTGPSLEADPMLFLEDAYELELRFNL
jgi:hypothetical protein